MQNVRQPLLFGEVLFDIFPDKSLVGGAPFNVAWHLRGFGLAPLFVSSVGKDPLGQQIVDDMETWGMDTSALQHDAAFPTGQVTVVEEDGQPHYTIQNEQAYDYIDNPVIPATTAPGFALLYHGTLALRGEHNRHTLDQLLKRLHLPCFVDLNLREPWWWPDLVKDTLMRAKWAKMSEEELEVVCTIAKIPLSSVETRIQQVARHYQLDTLYVTRGESGSYAWRDGRIFSQHAYSSDDFKDSVGAGDAFTAVCILGLLAEWDIQLTMQRAAAFAALICGERGALINDSSRYLETLKKWTDSEE